MDANDSQNEKQLRKPNAFTVIKNVRDMCELSDAKKILMFTLATYCNPDGICYPGNRVLALATRKSERTIQRMLKELEADGEVEILTPGIGRGKKRILRLKRYAPKTEQIRSVLEKADKALSPLNTTRSLGKTSGNNHSEQPHSIESTPHLLRKSRLIDFDRDGLLSEDQHEAIAHYNRELKPLGFSPVTKISPELEKVLDVFPADDIRRLVDVVANGDADDDSIPKRRTLVRLLWHNY
jgi:Helix-turn-helix domain